MNNLFTHDGSPAVSEFTCDASLVTAASGITSFTCLCLWFLFAVSIGAWIANQAIRLTAVSPRLTTTLFLLAALVSSQSTTKFGFPVCPTQIKSRYGVLPRMLGHVIRKCGLLIPQFSVGGGAWSAPVDMDDNVPVTGAPFVTITFNTKIGHTVGTIWTVFWSGSSISVASSPQFR
jgi:hypothetical protein